jgi:hypothetical protein
LSNAERYPLYILLALCVQVKNFGRSGRTKWTHLLNEDTSVQRKEDEWYK